MTQNPSIRFVTESAAANKYDSLNRAQLERGVRRKLLRNNGTAAVAPAGNTPTISVTQGNVAEVTISGGGVYYPANSPVIRLRGATLGVDTTPTLPTTPVSGGATPVFVAPSNLTAYGDTPSYRAEIITDALICNPVYLGTALPRWRVLVDGAVVSLASAPANMNVGGTATPFSPAFSQMGPQGTNYLGDGKTHFSRMTFTGAKVLRRITIECFSGMEFGGFIVGKGDVIMPGHAGVTQSVVLGDSYTAGTGADGGSVGWAPIMCDLLGWDMWQSGSGGTGYLAPNPTNGTAGPKLRDRLAADLYTLNPTEVVIAMGINDGAFTSTQVGTEAAAVYADIATHLPGVPVYVFGAWQQTSTPSGAQTAIQAAIAAAAAAAPNVKAFIDPTGWFQGTGYVGATTGLGPTDYLIRFDGVHPTQAGHEYLGRRCAAALSPLLVIS